MALITANFFYNALIFQSKFETRRKTLIDHDIMQTVKR